MRRQALLTSSQPPCSRLGIGIRHGREAAEEGSPLLELGNHHDTASTLKYFFWDVSLGVADKSPVGLGGIFRSVIYLCRLSRGLAQGLELVAAFGDKKIVLTGVQPESSAKRP